MVVYNLRYLFYNIGKVVNVHAVCIAQVIIMDLDKSGFIHSFIHSLNLASLPPPPVSRTLID